MASIATLPVHASFSIASLNTISSSNQAAVASAAPASREENIAAHLMLVRTIARRLLRTLPQHIELDELVSAGYVGLLDAADKFHPTHDTSFRSYAEFRIRGAIMDSLRELDPGSRGLRRKARAIEQTRCTLMTSLGRTVEDTEVAAQLSIGVKELRSTLAEVKAVATESLQASSEDEEGQDLLATLADTSILDPLSNCLKGELRQRLADAIDTLPERERLVLTLSYYEELTLKEIGSILTLTESRVSQLRTSAVRKLRQELAS